MNSKNCYAEQNTETEIIWQISIYVTFSNSEFILKIFSVNLIEYLCIESLNFSFIFKSGGIVPP